MDDGVGFQTAEVALFHSAGLSVPVQKHVGLANLLFDDGIDFVSPGHQFLQHHLVWERNEEKDYVGLGPWRYY